MIRVLIFILWVVLFAAALTILFGLKAVIQIEAFGWRLDIPAGVAILMILGAAGLVALATSITKDMVSAPRMRRARREIALREKGLAAITRGLDAIAMGDGARARGEAATAAKALGPAPVAHLIAAQAAQIAGDDAAADEALAGLLNSPETEFLALRGLYAKAMRDGDHDSARHHSSRAFDLRGKARWAFDAVFDLALSRLDYGEARAALTRAAGSKAIDAAAADRGLAATISAAAYASYARGDMASAIADADAALKRAPGFAPAAVLAARLHAERGEIRKAEKILAAAFAIAPERAPVESLAVIFADDDLASALGRIADRNPDSREAVLAQAQAALLRGDAAAAATLLAGALKSSASARALALMAQAQSALNGEAAARVWLSMAAAAPRDDAPSTDAFFRVTDEGWRRLIHDYMDHGRLAPPPLEAPPAGIEADLALPAPLPPTDPEKTTLEIAPVAPISDDAPATDDSDRSNAAADEALNRDAEAARGVS